ncbi:hypothetical protein AAZX31_15G247200 [Glycine max]
MVGVETEKSFVWLLSTWLEAILGAYPKTVITDQDTAFTNVISIVFPTVNHHYCIEFKSQFGKYIHQSIPVEEFESDWGAMIDKYRLQDNNTPPNKFVIQYEKTFDARYNMERDKTFKIVNSKPLMQTCYAMEEKASKFYMRILFVANKIKLSIEVSRYKVHEIYKEKSNYYTCAKCIPKEKGFSLPAQYILSRWTINAKKEKAKGLASEDFHEDNNEASDKKKHHDVAIEGIQELMRRLDLL